MALVAWRGVPLEEMTREGLIEALRDAADEVRRLRADALARADRRGDAWCGTGQPVPWRDRDWG